LDAERIQAAPFEGKTVKEWLVLLHPREAQKERRFDAPEVLAESARTRWRM
jgi:hypothetical protein